MFTQRPKCLFSVFFQRTTSDTCAVHSVVKCRVLDGRSRSSFVRKHDKVSCTCAATCKVAR